MSEPTLYQRLGGYDAIAAVCADLLPRLQADPLLERFWLHRGEDGIKREYQLLVDFLCNAAGGPMYYTGRLLESAPVMTRAFVAINLAALLRVALPLLFPGLYSLSMAASGLAWVAAFGLFVVVYAPMLLRPRVDGKPG